MTEFMSTIRPFFLPIGFVAGGIFASWVFNRIIVHRLEKLTILTTWSFDDIVLKNIRNYISFWLFAIASLTASIISAYTSKFGTRFQNSALFINIVRGIIITMGIVMLLQTFGISITPILGAMGIGSLAAGFALKDTLANFFAGIQILASKQLRTGDFIQLSDGQKGYITDITLRNTTLLSRDNNTIVVPNAQFAVETVLNLNIPMKYMRVKIDCGVAYDSDLDKVEGVVRETAEYVMKNVPGGIPDFTPRFRFHTFADFSINFTVIMRADDYPAQWEIRNEFIKRLKTRFDEEGIEIPFPVRTLVQK